MEVQNILCTLLVDDDSPIISFRHHNFVLPLQLNLILRIQMLLAMTPTFFGSCLLQAVRVALHVLAVGALLLEQHLVLDLCLGAVSLALAHRRVV